MARSEPSDSGTGTASNVLAEDAASEPAAGCCPLGQLGNGAVRQGISRTGDCERAIETFCRRATRSAFREGHFLPTLYLLGREKEK